MTLQSRNDDWTDRLSEYLDGELTPDERVALERHLAGCGACAATLEELRRVVERMRSLPARAPAADLWGDIAERIDARPPMNGRVVPMRTAASRRFSFTLPQLAAASVLLALLSGGIAWRLAGRPEGLHSDGGSADLQVRPEVDRGRPSADAPADSIRVEPVGLADAEYDSAVADLQRAVRNGRGHLDPATIAIVEQNLKIIDRAIDQAKQAVMDDPGNSYVTSHLVETRRKKLDLLRRAAALASETN
jgi:anti-sigma factor RsiW